MNAMLDEDPARACVVGGTGPATALDSALVGSKASNLAKMHALGLAVPPALAFTTDLARSYMQRGALPEGFRARIARHIQDLDSAAHAALGRSGPLIVSVRSSPPQSMPGMLGTVLNVGMTEDTVSGLIKKTGNPWLAWDTYRRFVLSFTEQVFGTPPSVFEQMTAERMRDADASTVQDMDPVSMRDLARATAAAVGRHKGWSIPSDPAAQVAAAIEAVLRSWASPSAREYRRLNGLDDATGTGVIVQAMVLGNGGSRSGSGVGFTRNPANGEPEMYVDFVFNAQGEDVVSGRLPVTDALRLPDALPTVWAQLRATRQVLEREFMDMQDIEFTVDEGKLFFLQTRPGKRTPWAALRIAVDLVREGILDEGTALERLAPYDLYEIARTAVRPDAADTPLARATPASVGVASGAIVFDTASARERAPERQVVLVRSELSTDDIAGLAVAAGILTTFGARTSHAAVVARQLGKVCLVGCGELVVDDTGRTCTIGQRRFREGDEVTLDGESGYIYPGAVPVVTERPESDLAVVADWRSRQFATEIRQPGTPAVCAR